MKRLCLLFVALTSVIATFAQTDSTNVAGNVRRLQHSTTIDESNMNNRDQSSNAIDAIKGRVAGLTVERNEQNAMNAVRLRGTTSLTGNNDPLIIVDGVLGDMSLLESVYPTDIESFRIMKDASETAQYGSRGSSGIIEITTMKGHEGKLRVHYNGSVSVGSVYKTLNMLSADEYRAVNAQNGLTILDKGYNTNWQKQIVRNAISDHHHIALTGGGNRTTYRASIGLMDDRQVVSDNGVRTIMSSINISQRLFGDVLKIDMGMFGSVQRDRLLFGEQKLFYSAATFNPTFPAQRNESGSWDSYPAASQIANPKAWLQNKVENENIHLSTNLNLDFKIIESLHLKLFGAYTIHHIDNTQNLPTEEGGTAILGTDKQNTILGNASLNFDKSWDKHSLSASVLAEMQTDNRNGHHITKWHSTYASLNADKLSAGALLPWEGTDSYKQKANMLSFMARASYTLLNRYSISGSIRTDGSSKFGKNNRWGYFPSVSATWIMTNEKWLKNNAILTDLRLSAGYGMSGNQSGIDSYLTMNLYEPNGLTTIGGKQITTFAALRNANPDLKWEVSRTANVGIDLNLFAGRLLTTISYYNTHISDMLYPYYVSTPPYTYPLLIANLGSMRNQGVEISIGGMAVNTKDWNLTINCNITWQQNRLLGLDGWLGDEYLYASDYQALASLSGAGSHGGENDIVWQIVGQPLGAFYLPHFEGFSGNENSGYQYKAGEKYIAGQATPKVLIGSNISLRYKDWDLTIQMNGAFGHKIFNGTSLAYMNMNSLPFYNVLKDAPKLNIYDQRVTDYWLEKGDYLNIDYITLGYQVPLPENKIVESLRLVATMNNVATISSYSGLSPMINSSNINSTIGVDDKRTYPLYHTYTFGLSIGF